LGEFIFLIYVPLKTGRGKREERWKGEGEGGKEERERERGGRKSNLYALLFHESAERKRINVFNL